MKVVQTQLSVRTENFGLTIRRDAISPQANVWAREDSHPHPADHESAALLLSYRPPNW